MSARLVRRMVSQHHADRIVVCVVSHDIDDLLHQLDALGVVTTSLLRTIPP